MQNSQITMNGGDMQESGIEAGEDPWARCLEQIAEHRDRAAFRKVFEHFAPLVRAFLARSPGGDWSQAEEITQEVMIKIWRKSASFNSSKASATTWIYTIARNTRIDFIRRRDRKERRVAVEDMWHEAEAAEEPLVDLQQKRAETRIRKALSELPDEQAQVLFKAFMEGKSHNEVAEELQIPLGTVKSRIRLALGKLQVMIDR
ncbi:MAG: sigma-70 family RNA polymerase sigma factor [Pseudomonadota bacterium]